MARLLVHIVAAGWAVAQLGPLQAAGPVGSLLAGIGVVWAINLYNFMDGIDGLAAIEAITAAGAAAVLLAAGGHIGLALAAGLVAASALGFLPWNWPPARIFMGDVGSGLLGYLFGALALAGHNAGALSVAGWLALLGVFVFDATATLLRRLVAGERVSTAHRLHAYQRLVQSGWPHRRVTFGAAAANGFLAAAVWWDWRTGGGGGRALVIAIVILAGLYLAVERAAPARRFAHRPGGSYP
jgi:Fuc2NAc and GlcNAc transferase